MDKIYNRLVELAKQAFENDETPASALIIDDNQNIIAESYNLTRIKNNPLKHAEINCLNDTFEKLDTKALPEYTLISSLEPCSMCSTAITYARIKKCIFLVKSEKDGAIIHNSKIPNTQKNLFKTQFEYVQVPQSEKLSKILSAFFKGKRK